ncbi:NAD(P)/FAD-dependent oxidoreductase [Pseudanabaena sp. FACHB-1998]|uniref:FAD-dependent oxidoreductase n=1 Tax=Pseudanabaena sp. FACHB-1998 TaxID=2692858 RepID=UPI0016819A58|nr:FAD-dependent oxidoreductase [Pseudanabaena sp. FACHB-1998]MBD2175911.1 NAD(P)/FAD-dependent oxidoreductase [Pseudanabaena sp. FACHB-1998]
MVDYDLAVIGMSANAFKLVNLAIKSSARVAWIWDRQVSDNYLNVAEAHHVFQQLIVSLSNQLPLEGRPERQHLFANNIAPFLSKYRLDEILENIPKSGVDVILGKCRFREKLQDLHVLEINKDDPKAALSEENPSRQILTAHIYAIAYDQPTFLPKIFGLMEHDYLTATQLLQLQDLPNSIAVLGGDADACAIAQSLNFLGVHTSLITNSLHILPEVDVAIARTLQAQLEAEGVEIYTNTQITAVSYTKHRRSKIWLDNQILECDRLLIPVEPIDLAIPRDRGIYQVHSQADIDLILQKVSQRNSFWKSKSISKPAITFVPTNPPLAQIGMTELAAQQQKLKSICILESASTNLGLCKIICNHQGLILGASMVGDNAKIVIEAIAIAMQGKVKVQDLSILEDMQFSRYSLPSEELAIPLKK